MVSWWYLFWSKHIDDVLFDGGIAASWDYQLFLTREGCECVWVREERKRKRKEDDKEKEEEYVWQSTGTTLESSNVVAYPFPLWSWQVILTPVQTRQYPCSICTILAYSFGGEEGGSDKGRGEEEGGSEEGRREEEGESEEGRGEEEGESEEERGEEEGGSEEERGEAVR